MNESQAASARIAAALDSSYPVWALKFRLLEAQSAAWTGNYEEVLRILTALTPPAEDSDLRVSRLTLIGSAYSHSHNFAKANANLLQADWLCSLAESPACGGLMRTHGNLAVNQGRLDDAYDYFAHSLASSRKFKQPMDEATALMNLGHVCLLEEKFDEAIDWSNSANKLAQDLQAQDILALITGNLGWAYYSLGDATKALGLLSKAEELASKVHDQEEDITVLNAMASAYRDSHDFSRAASSLLRARNLARETKNESGIIDATEDLAHISIESGQLQDAKQYLDEATPLVQATGNGLDISYVTLARGKLAAAQRDAPQAQTLFEQVEKDPASQVSMRFAAEHELARLFEVDDQTSRAASMYRTALDTFESARTQLKEDDSKLPFQANATSIYDDYIHFLVTQGKLEEALLVADQSRARTLAQDFGIDLTRQSPRVDELKPQAIAKKAGATLLFYWIGEKQSYLWIVTPGFIRLFPLPPKAQVARAIEHYHKTLLGPDDPLDDPDSAGRSLYRTLINPAGNFIPRDIPVMILSDGSLSLLNFETLIVDAPKPHYWIEDVTLIAAPSLAMLAAAKPATNPINPAPHALLLMGDAISADENYPELVNAPLEMKQVSKHFSMQQETVFSRQQANPAAYLASNPRQFTYIHFVAHGVASSAEPLDSAIILSHASTAQSSFKLHAREIMKHPIDARLVTISACYGSGTRAYVGEGLVGLSWAFLRAGAHNAIGALWEASDSSTPKLMDDLYQGLQQGEPPAVALRMAKLNQLHTRTIFRRPFYWAPFQIYTRL